MKKWICIAIAVVWGLPQYGHAQFLSIDNLAIHAGIEYPVIYDKRINSPYESGENERFIVRPHARISYQFIGTDYFQVSVYTGYSQLGGRMQAENSRTTIKMHTLSLGLKTLYKSPVLHLGPVFSWNNLRYANYHYEYKNRTTEGWLTSANNNGIENYLAKNAFELGLILQRQLGSHFLVSFEGLYGVNDVYKNEELHGEAINVGDIQWYPIHYRLSVGYSF